MSGSRPLVAGAAALFALLVALPVVAVVTAFGAVGGSGGTGVAAATIPPAALAAYQAAASTCPGLSWTVLAAIGEVESDHGRSRLPGVDDGANAAGAEGPMQFLPATFAAYAVPRPDGRPPSPYDMGDATLAAARMLCADGGGDPSTLPQALWAYNHSWGYVTAVLGWAARYGTPAPSSAGAVAVAWALQQVGLPYVWGAAGPAAFDCSGLALRAWQAAGVTLPRVAVDQYAAGTHVPVADAEPGDLVFFGPDPSDPATIDHVGVYVGDGLMVDAPHTGADVEVEPVWPDPVPDVTRPWA